MTERGPDQNRARNGPEKDERLAVEPAEGDADEPVDEKRAEYPRGQVRRRKPPARAHGEDDSHRTRGREDERDQAVYEVDAAEIGERLARGSTSQSLPASSAAFPREPAGVTLSRPPLPT